MHSLPLLAAAHTASDVSLPLSDPVLIFSLVLFIILLMPIVAKRLRVPGLISLILAGVAVGPYGFNLLRRDSSIVLFGTVGLLYIMFLAGLELDLNAFKKTRNRSLAFGALTFALPLLLGLPVCYWILGYQGMASLMIASMFATHTLVAYPIVSRLGLTRTEAVAITVGGTIITDTAVLLILAVLTGSVEGTLNAQFWLRLGVSLAVFGLVVFWGFPRIGSWFFKHLEGEKTAQYIFVLAMVFLAAFMAQMAGVEPIIGAFAAGLALNPLIPHNSSLMNRIEFVGNALFIPFFLISVGMLVDLRVLFNGPQALFVAVTLTAVALLSKWLAAMLTGQIFGYSLQQRQLIFGLSSSHAAATLAVILIGFELQILDENALNGTIVLILITCLVASFVTERAGRALVIEDSDSVTDTPDFPEKILVSLSNPHTMEKLLDFALLIKTPRSPQPLYPLVVVEDDEDARHKLIQSRKTVERALRHASDNETAVEVVTRVDLNVANGISRAVKELMITDIVLAWSEKISTLDRIFGTKLAHLLERTWQNIYVCHFLYPLNTLRKIVLVVPANAELEAGFTVWVKKLEYLADQTGASLLLCCNDKTHESLEAELDSLGSHVRRRFQRFDDWDDLLVLSRSVGLDDLFVLVAARPATVSHVSAMESLNFKLARHFQSHNFLVVYPEQNPVVVLAQHAPL
ncbi:MAG: cation:proton antiporter [Candidatus Sericytochromatia bacterium]